MATIEVNDLPNDSDITGAEKVLVVDTADSNLGKTITVSALDEHILPQSRIDTIQSGVTNTDVGVRSNTENDTRYVEDNTDTQIDGQTVSIKGVDLVVPTSTSGTTPTQLPNTGFGVAASANAAINIESSTNPFSMILATGDGAQFEPTMIFIERDATPNVDSLFSIQGRGNNSDGTQSVYTTIRGHLLDADPNNERGYLGFKAAEGATIAGNTDEDIVRIGSINATSVGLEVRRGGVTYPDGTTQTTAATGLPDFVTVGTAGSETVNTFFNSQTVSIGATTLFATSTGITVGDSFVFDGNVYTFTATTGTSHTFTPALVTALPSATRISIYTPQDSLIFAPGSGIAIGNPISILNDFEDGVWNPTQGSRGTVTAGSNTHGRYTKVGSLVTAQFSATVTTQVSGSLNLVDIEGLPFIADFPNTRYTDGFASILGGGAGGTLYAVATVDNRIIPSFPDPITSIFQSIGGTIIYHTTD